MEPASRTKKLSSKLSARRFLLRRRGLLTISTFAVRFIGPRPRTAILVARRIPSRGKKRIKRQRCEKNWVLALRTPPPTTNARTLTWPRAATDKPMTAGTLTQTKNYKVADMNLAEWGRKEIMIAEKE